MRTTLWLVMIAVSSYVYGPMKDISENFKGTIAWIAFIALLICLAQDIREIVKGQK